MGYIPDYIQRNNERTYYLASRLGVRIATKVDSPGLYVAIRSKRDPINTNRKRKYITVRYRRSIRESGGIYPDLTEEVFRSEESTKGFPSDHLIAQLMLVT